MCVCWRRAENVTRIGYRSTVIAGIVVIQVLSRVQHVATPWNAACQSPLSSSISWSLLKLVCRVSDTIQPSHPLPPPFSSCPQSFAASESFPVSQLFTSGGQSTGASASASVSFAYKNTHTLSLQRELKKSKPKRPETGYYGVGMWEQGGRSKG